MKGLIVGQGELGWRTLQILAHADVFDELLAVDANPAQGARTNMVRYGAQLLGRRTRVGFAVLDALDASAVEELLTKFRPDAVVNTASLQAWHVILQLPKALWLRIHSAGLGVWLPAHLAPAKALMEAIRQTGIDPFVVNMAFPDAVNPILHTAGLGPHLGAGNIEELAVPFTAAIADQYGVSTDDVRVSMAGHHWVNAAVLENRQVENIPLLVEVEVAGETVTADVDVGAVLLSSTTAFPPGYEDTWLIAASAAHKVLAAHGLAPSRCHATGVGGLPGGYPVRLDGRNVHVDLPAGMTLDDARRVNLEGQRLDGISHITEDGDAVLTDHARSVIRDLLGWEYERYRLADATEQALELARRYSEFAARAVNAS